jgi:hypothetical protein
MAADGKCTSSWVNTVAGLHRAGGRYLSGWAMGVNSLAVFQD